MSLGMAEVGTDLIFNRTHMIFCFEDFHRSRDMSQTHVHLSNSKPEKNTPETLRNAWQWVDSKSSY